MPPIKHAKKGKTIRGNPNGALLVALARSWLGVRYVYGGTTRQGVDCSGLIQNVAFEAGIDSCPRTSEEQWAWVKKITASEAGPGDLIFFVGAELDPPPGHVSIIVSPGTVISADAPGTVVRYDHYSLNGTGVAKVIGFGRMPGVSPSKSANYSVVQDTSRASAAIIGGPVSGVVASVVVILFVVLLFAALIIVAIHFRS